MPKIMVKTTKLSSNPFFSDQIFTSTNSAAITVFINIFRRIVFFISLATILNKKYYLILGNTFQMAVYSG